MTEPTEVWRDLMKELTNKFPELPPTKVTPRLLTVALPDFVWQIVDGADSKGNDLTAWLIFLLVMQQTELAALLLKPFPKDVQSTPVVIQNTTEIMNTVSDFGLKSLNKISLDILTFLRLICINYRERNIETNDYANKLLEIIDEEMTNRYAEIAKAAALEVK